MKGITVGICGYGRIGREHAAWIQRSGSQVWGVFDPTPARRELAAADGWQVFQSRDELLASQPEAVLVASPTSEHLDDAKAAIRNGRAVMVEKPVALDAAGAVELDRLAREAGKSLCVFQNRRWDRDFLTLRTAVQEGSLGKLINVESRLGQYASCVGPAAAEWRPQWRTEARWGGGGLYDWGSHFVDQVRLMLEPARCTCVFAQMRPGVWSRDCDDFARVCMEFSDGTVALVEINTLTHSALPRWHVDGTLATVSSPSDPGFDLAVWSNFTVSSKSDAGEAGQLQPQEFAEPEVWIWKEFARACRGMAAVPVPIEGVIQTMRILDAARRSASDRQAVRLE